MQLEANLGQKGLCFAWLAKQAENSPKMGSPATLHAEALHQLCVPACVLYGCITIWGPGAGGMPTDCSVPGRRSRSW